LREVKFLLIERKSLSAQKTSLDCAGAVSTTDLEFKPRPLRISMKTNRGLMIQDFESPLRQLFKSPGLTIAAVK
jgi:hypothetical protein